MTQLYLRMMCRRRPEVNQVPESWGGWGVKKKKAQLARVYCLCDCWWRQALKKRQLRNALFWWGWRLLQWVFFLFFVIAAAIRRPDRFPGKAGEVVGLG